MLSLHLIRTAPSLALRYYNSRSSIEELLQRDKANLDIFWLKRDSFEDRANLTASEVIAAEIMEDLQAALEQFALIAEDIAV